MIVESNKDVFTYLEKEEWLDTGQLKQVVLEGYEQKFNLDTVQQSYMEQELDVISAFNKSKLQEISNLSID